MLKDRAATISWLRWAFRSCNEAVGSNRSTLCFLRSIVSPDMRTFPRVWSSSASESSWMNGRRGPWASQGPGKRELVLPVHALPLVLPRQHVLQSTIAHFSQGGLCGRVARGVDRGQRWSGQEADAQRAARVRPRQSLVSPACDRMQAWHLTDYANDPASKLRPRPNLSPSASRRVFSQGSLASTSNRCDPSFQSLKEGRAEDGITRLQILYFSSDVTQVHQALKKAFDQALIS